MPGINPKSFASNQTIHPAAVANKRVSARASPAHAHNTDNVVASVARLQLVANCLKKWPWQFDMELAGQKAVLTVAFEAEQIYSGTVRIYHPTKQKSYFWFIHGKYAIDDATQNILLQDTVCRPTPIPFFSKTLRHQLSAAQQTGFWRSMPSLPYGVTGGVANLLDGAQGKYKRDVDPSPSWAQPFLPALS